MCPWVRYTLVHIFSELPVYTHLDIEIFIDTHLNVMSTGKSTACHDEALDTRYRVSN